MTKLGGFRPWSGSEYDSTRLLLLGESAYSWVENGVQHHPSADHSSVLVREALVNLDCATRFMRLLSRGLTNEYAPSVDRISAAWAKVMFTNYVGGTVGDGPRQRPTAEFWRAAADEWRGFLDVNRPKRVIVLGKSLWASMPQTDVHLSDDVQGYQLPDGSIAMCWAVRHPSAGLSWTGLAEVLEASRAYEIALFG